VHEPPSVYDHVVWIVMENHSHEQIIGSSDAPYLNKLTVLAGIATNFYAEAHPSLPNHIAMTSGSTPGHNRRRPAG
jgi:phosphatidylinositol-3-phosphatase